MGNLIEEKERHGFITFWLWFGIIINVLIASLSLLMYLNFKKLGIYGEGLTISGYDLNSFDAFYSNYNLITSMCTFLCAILCIIFISYIFKWRKLGFWSIVVNNIFFGIINLIMMIYIENEYPKIRLASYVTQQAIITIILISPFILWAVLQIKKNGISCWKLLK